MHAQAAAAGHQHVSRLGEVWRGGCLSLDAWSDVAHNFRGDWEMLWKEITRRLPDRRVRRAAADGRSSTISS